MRIVIYGDVIRAANKLAQLSGDNEISIISTDDFFELDRDAGLVITDDPEIQDAYKAIGIAVETLSLFPAE